MAIKKRNIGANQVDGARILLLNNEPIRALSYGQNPTALSLLRLNADNELIFNRIPKISEAPTSSSDIVNKNYVDTNFITNAQLGSTVATLGPDGKIPSTQIPKIAITDVYVRATIELRDELVVEVGDICKVTGVNKTYIYDGSTWVELSATADVTSVAGKIGAVTLNTADVSESVSGPYYFTESRARAAVVVDLLEGSFANTTTYAPSVAAVKSLLTGLTTDDIVEGSTRFYYTDNRARTASVLNIWNGSETTQAPSVSSIVSYVGSSQGSLSSALANEISRAQAAEASLALGLSGLQTDLLNEATSRNTAINGLQTQITNEVNSRSTAVTNEQSRATAAEASLAAAIYELSSSVGAGGFLKADNNLGNLFETAINVDLLPSAASIRNLGSFNLPFATARLTDVVLQNAAASNKAQLLINPTVPSGTTPSNIDVGLAALSTGSAAIVTAGNATANSTATGAILIETGNKTAGTGSSGGISLRTGTSSGGSRGEVSVSASQLNMNSAKIVNLAAPSNNADAARYIDVIGVNNALTNEFNSRVTAVSSLQTQITNEVNSRVAAVAAEQSRAIAAESALLALNGSRAMAADLNMGSFKIINLADPVSNQHAATKLYVDTAISAATGAGSQINTDNIIEGSVNLFYTTARAKADTLINSMAGSQTTLAPSVKAVKDFVTSSIAGNMVTAGSALAYDALNPLELDVQVDDSSIYVNSNQLAVKDGGVTNAKLASGSVTTSKIANNTITGAKVRLANDEALRARNFADSADVSIVKIDTGDKVQFLDIPRLPLNSTPTIGQEIVSKSYVDNYFATTFPQVQREIIPITNTHITNGYVELQNQVNPAGLVVYTNSRVMLMPSTAGASGDYAITVVSSKTRIVFENDIASGGVSALEAYDAVTKAGDVLYIMYFPMSGAGKGQESIQTQIETPTNKAYTLMLSAPRSMAIESLVAQTASGSCTIDVQINGVSVGNMDTVSISTTKVSRVAGSLNLINAGDTVTLVVSDNDSVVDLVFSLTIS